MGHQANQSQSNEFYISYASHGYHYETLIYDSHTPTTILNLLLFPTTEIPHLEHKPSHPKVITPFAKHHVSTKSNTLNVYVIEHVKYYTYKIRHAKQPYSKAPSILEFPCVLPIILDATLTQNPILYILFDSYNTSNIQSFPILLVLRLYQKTIPLPLLQAKERYT